MRQAVSVNSIDSIIQSIASLQSRGDAYFPEGIFPSYRQNPYLRYRRPDNNIFYTATIVFVLNQLKSYLSAANQAVIETITAKAVNNYPAHQNKDGLGTYNFWQTPKDGRRSGHFSGGYVFHRMEHFRIPDDIDDTALVYLTQPANKKEAGWLKEKLQQHANLSPGPARVRQIKNTFSHYKHLRGYSTWFGKNMGIEFDACALCNLMYLFERHRLPYNEYDADTYAYLSGIIEHNEYLKKPFVVARNYATALLIIYHYARLLGDFEVPHLEAYRNKLIEDTLTLLEKHKWGMNRVILQTALLRLSRKGHSGFKKAIEQILSEPRVNTTFKAPFYYFRAALLGAYENPVLRFLAPMAITHMHWECEAHELVLILENLIERQKY
ncbi:hypothetical protein [Emticicia sp. TH156]|uniref:hypothetical protein n=1 Tax=Emticicia sp. TH156 TaxID=2067454 RepID=UPI000C77B499|nr:hypothetical protein [Emticicia sp. TH156]PLK46010.1 hypothetical protein C0V77_01275 [Emticicia sp. TH156]